MTTNADTVKPQLNHRGLLAVGAVVAIALIIIVAVGTWMYIDLRKHERELRGLLNPTAQQFRDQLQQGLKRCLREPQCRKLFPQLTIRRNPRTHRPTVVPVSRHRNRLVTARERVPSRPGATSTRPVRRTPPHRRRPPKTVPVHRRPSRPTPPPQPPPPPPSPPPKPPPPVVITVPVPAHFCNQLIQLNKCPSNPLSP